MGQHLNTIDLSRCTHTHRQHGSTGTCVRVAETVGTWPEDMCVTQQALRSEAATVQTKYCCL